MFGIPTTHEGMSGAIGHFINDVCANKINAQIAEATARAAAPGFVPEAYTWDQKAKPKAKFSMDVFCASIREGVGSKRGMRAC